MAHLGLARASILSGAVKRPARISLTAFSSARDGAHLVVQRLFAVEGIVAGCVGLVVADEAVESGLLAGVDQAHPVKPVRQRTAHFEHAGNVAMDHQAIGAAGQVLRVVPPAQLELLRTLRVLARGARWIGVSAIGTDQAVDHQLEHARSLVPMNGRENQYAMGGRPLLVDLRHPIVDLVECVVRIARAGPVAQRHRRRDATLAWVDRATVLGGQAAQVQQIDRGAGGVKHFLRHLHKAERLGRFAGARAVVAGRTADQQHARRSAGVLLGLLRALDSVSRGQPIQSTDNA
jgi:hypothetical protein